MKRFMTVLMVLLLAAVPMVGCDDDSDLENAVEEVGDEIEDAADEVSDALGDGVDEVGDAVEGAGDAVGDAAKKLDPR